MATWLVLLLTVGAFLFSDTQTWADDWVFYAGSDQAEVKGAKLRDWYALNMLEITPETQAKTYHYFDRDSISQSSPFGGGTVRVWEKSVSQRETKSYDDARDEIVKEEEPRLKRKISVLDYSWLFPTAVNRASKETKTLFEIDCDSRAFSVLEANSYDKIGQRMTREAGFDMELWLPVQRGTVMEALFEHACKQESEQIDERSSEEDE